MRDRIPHATKIARHAKNACGIKGSMPTNADAAKFCKALKQKIREVDFAYTTIRRTGTRDDATNGPDAHKACCVSRGPKQVYGDLVSNGIIKSLIHVYRSSFGFDLRRRVFFLAHLTMFAFIIPEKCNNVKLFCEKLRKGSNYRELSSKMFKTAFILANLQLFVNIFLRKSQKK